MLKTAYLMLCIAGSVLPLSQFAKFLLAEGLNVNAFFGQLFANDVSSFFGFDLIVSSLVLWLFVFSEGSRLKMQNLWVYVASNLYYWLVFPWLCRCFSSCDIARLKKHLLIVDS